MTYGSNADTRYADWQEQANHDPDQDIDWRQVRREQADTDQWMRRRKPLDAQAWAKLNLDPWATL